MRASLSAHTSELLVSQRALPRCLRPFTAAQQCPPHTRLVSGKRRAGRVRHRPVAAAARDTDTAAPSRRASDSSPRSAKEAVEAGMEAFGKGDSQAALELFQAALSLRPNQVRFTVTHWAVREEDAVLRATTQQRQPLLFLVSWAGVTVCTACCTAACPSCCRAHSQARPYFLPLRVCPGVAAY